ncbi:uncharacterized protein PADG_04746 [Paracoccidioides brasiliensis Pb18]|uniref:Uncharacterized protein n=1 Tax=Paracoccidioides brasiliensis (strain Pb18) TaxID=502780 RepID=C1GCM4_PARBD|nr:uncharacterized protein PADG_04746 [Paracoccidioides brasiliensis Pb18]EEH48667.2 hypothetical protein PADG_04746 [Paracoccidioides brasiliensis Pb18]
MRGRRCVQKPIGKSQGEFQMPNSVEKVLAFTRVEKRLREVIYHLRIGGIAAIHHDKHSQSSVIKLRDLLEMPPTTVVQESISSFHRSQRSLLQVATSYIWQGAMKRP